MHLPFCQRYGMTVHISTPSCLYYCIQSYTFMSIIKFTKKGNKKSASLDHSTDFTLFGPPTFNAVLSSFLNFSSSFISNLSSTRSEIACIKELSVSKENISAKLLQKSTKNLTKLLIFWQNFYIFILKTVKEPVKKYL